MKQIKPPRLANILLRMILRREDYLEKTGDLEEVYSSLKDEKGRAIAGAWYWIQTIKAIPAIIINSFYWSMIMLKNYFKISLRKIFQQKMYSFITISSLAVGLGVFLLFLNFYLWRSNPDAFHKDIDRIYNVVQVLNSGSGDRHTAYVAYPLTPSIKNDIPEIEDYARFFEASRTIVKYKENSFFENQIYFADPNFLYFFNFDLIEGNFPTLLSEPNSIVLTKKTAEKYFGDESPIGKTLTLNKKTNVVVTGVLKNIIDMPTSSSIYFEFLVPLELAKSLYGPIDNWKDNTVTGFLRLKENSDLKLVENKLGQLRNKYYQSGFDSPKQLYLYPTRGLIYKAQHIERFANFQEPDGNVAFLIFGSLFIMIGIFNYINLTTARHTERLRELGVRKVVGAGKSNLIKQFLTESTLTAFLALPFTIITYNLVYSFMGMIAPDMPDISFWFDGRYLFASIFITFIIGLLAGLYPALFLSSLHPIQIISGKLKKGKSHGNLRKALVIVQFSLSVIFIGLTLALQKQANFLPQADLGYNRKGVFAIPLTDEVKEKYKIIKTRLDNFPEIENVTASLGVPGNWQTKKSVIPEGMEINNPVEMYSYGIDYNFFETMNIKSVSGRMFSKEDNNENNVIINQKFARNLGWDAPVGKSIKVDDKEYFIIGVVNDFQFDNLFWALGPAFFYLENNNPNYLLVKTGDSGKISMVTEKIRRIWNEYSQSTPFDTFTLDEYFYNSNNSVNITSKIFGMLGVLAILYSGLGLLALASFAVRLRKKEIAIRKTLGASMPVILAMLSRDFIKLVIIADMIAIPIAYIASKNLIEVQNTVTIALGAGIFIFTALFALIVAVVFMAAQVFKAAVANPVDSLKCE